MKKSLFILLAALPLFAAAQVPSYVPTNGLVGWWPFNGNANDESGNGNNGTIVGNTSLSIDRFGNVNKAYSFDGNGDYINCGNNPSVNITGSLTISAWVYATDLSSSRGIITKSPLPPVDDAYQLVVGPYVLSELNFLNSNCGYSVPLSNWIQIVSVFDSASQAIRIYCNGSLDTTILVGFSSIGTSSDDLCIGTHRPMFTSNWSWDGSLDDIGIWNRALTPCEIQALYNSGNSGITTAASSSSSICFGSSTTLSASGAATYSWMPGNLSGDSLSVSPAATTTYIVTGTDSSGCNSIDSVTIVVNALPQVVGVSTTSTYCLEDANGSLAGTPTPGTWSGPGVTGNSFNPATAGAGTHNVVYTYTDNNGCSNSDTLTMTVDLCTGLTEETNSSFTVFPNPANNNITVTWATPNVNTLTLSDATGRAVRTYNVSGTQVQLSLEGLASGVYFLSVELNKGVPQKVIIEK